MTDGPAARPTLLTLGAAIVGLQGAVIVVLALLELVHLTPSRATMGVTTALFFAAYGAALLLCARGLAHVSSWARGPVVLAQLIQLGLAWNFRGGGTTLVAVLLAVVALVVLGAVLAPASTTAIEGVSTRERPES